MEHPLCNCHLVDKVESLNVKHQVFLSAKQQIKASLSSLTQNGHALMTQGFAMHFFVAAADATLLVFLRRL